MTWTPEPQGPCPCCGPEPEPPATELGTGSTRRTLPPLMHEYEDPPARPVTREWIEQTDPAPAEEPPRPGAFRRILNATRRNT